MNKLKTIGILCTVLLLTAFSPAPDADGLVGVWEPSHGKARIKIEKIGTKYYGKIVWLREPIDPATQEKKVDKNNPDEAFRTKPLLGLRVLKDFEFTNNSWENGTIYDPENGNTYNCKITPKDENTVEIRGYVGVPTFGRTDVWKRLKM